MRALITGGTGFVGLHLARELAGAGWEVLVTDHDDRDRTRLPGGVEFGLLDVRDAGACRRVLAAAGAEVCFHLAGQAHVARSRAAPGETLELNVLGTWNVLEAFGVGPGARCFVFPSTAYVYAPGGERDVDEQHPERPTTPYGVSKLAAEGLVLRAASRAGFRPVVLRLFNHIGPGQAPHFVAVDLARRLLGLAARARAGETDLACRVGNLASERDYTDVRDVVRAYRLVAEAGEGQGTFNVGSGRGRTVLDLLQAMEAELGIRPRHEVDPDLVREGEVRRFVADPARLRALTGWEPRFPLEETLADVLADVEARGLADRSEAD